MTAWDATLAAIDAAQERVERTVARMTDAQAQEPSLLPGWNRAMVVTHLARNADGIGGMIAAKLRGEDRAQYPGGDAQRDGDIAAGRNGSATTLLADLRTTAAGLREVLAAVRAEHEDLPLVLVGGSPTVAARTRARLLEVEVHHADLGLAYSWRNWPDDVAALLLDQVVAGIGTRLGADAPPLRIELATPSGNWALETPSALVSSPAPARVEGGAGAVFAWLLGRAAATEAGLHCSGDEQVARLPEWAPW